ncbi:uncharacterized protein LOC144928566 isoform X2 [Branchiostoma floridae x Branchiostoma belcheri]
MASVHGREERAGNNYAQEDAPCPLWCLWEAETVPDHVPVCAVGPVCVPVQIPAGGSVGYPVHLFLCVFLKDLSPIYETREHWTCDHVDPETGLQQEEEPDFYRQGCVKEDGEE